MDIEQKVQYVLDRFEIQDVITRYSFGQDMHQGDDRNILETWRDVFTTDAVLDYRAAGSEPTSYENMAEIMRGNGATPGNMSGFSNWQHLMGNPVVTISGDKAAARTDLWATHKGKTIEGKSAPSLYVAGAFTDELVRTANGWRISYRKLELHFMDLINSL
ncbi:nuclear transport factor 2 family protein [Chitinophaga sp. CC14]|uniref:nuclear transport factor 2 family protein n=1 Tax=Chitinophaga sp. CC14 TaxID=3029199 RepID=UPI003B797FBE